MDLIANTSYLCRVVAWAAMGHGYAYSNPEKSIGLPWVALGEFWHGAILKHDPVDVAAFLSIGIHVHDATLVVLFTRNLCQVIAIVGLPENVTK